MAARRSTLIWLAASGANQLGGAVMAPLSLMTQEANMTQEATPTWGYRLVKGEVEQKIFPTGKLPKGWKDTPAGLKDGNS